MCEYSKSNINVDREEVVRRKYAKDNLASDYLDVNSKVEKLLNSTDVYFDEKEELLDGILESMSKLEICKRNYETDIQCDLNKFDLTEEKSRSADQTKINIGKFTGTPGYGEDFYSFKTKFLNAYEDYPKKLIIEYLKNNHLGGVAKDCVGTLNTLDEIWERLEQHFGDTQLMLLFQFDKILKLGPMSKQRSYTLKKNYLQTLINCMQDALDLSIEHDLGGEVHYGGFLNKVISSLWEI